jgi:HrpA-like RNA helicase
MMSEPPVLHHDQWNYSDFLDAKGRESVNWFTGLPYSPAYLVRASKWSTLPMYKTDIVKTVVDSIRVHPVTILTAGTGVGKSVTVPKYLLRMFYLQDNGQFNDKIAMTTPKRSTTKFAADYAADCLDVPIGTKVDYGYRGHPASQKAQLLFCTDGMLLARIMGTDPLLREFRGIIIDEAHERPVPTDILLFFLRKILLQRPEFRVIVMSATMDARPYVNYFKDTNPNVIDVAGKPNHPIKSYYLPSTPSKKQSIVAAWECVGFLVGSTQSGDILAFVPKIKDTKDACRNLMSNNKKDKNQQILFTDVACLSVYASVDDDTMLLVKDMFKFKETGKRRRVMFATNVAESSLTIEGIMFVIDTGLELNVKWDAAAHANSISVDWITQGQIKQRIGRTGRTSPGVAYHMYTKEHMESLSPLPPPKLLTVDICDYVIRIIQRFSLAEAVRTFAGLLTPPSVAQVVDSIAYLHFYGLVTVFHTKDANKKPLAFDVIDYSSMKSFDDLLAYDGAVTDVGRAMAMVDGLSPVYALLLIWGSVFGCLRDMTLLAVIFEVTNGNVDLLWDDPEGPSAKTLKIIQDPVSDHKTIINAYDMLYAQRKIDGLSLGIWNTINAKAGRYYNLAMPSDTTAALRKHATILGLTPFENALLAARCFHLANSNGTNIFPLKTTSGVLDRKLGKRMSYPGIYEELMIIGDQSKYNVVTYFPVLEGITIK